MKKYLFLLLLVAVGTATYAQTPADSAGKSKKHSSTKKADQVEINSTSHQTVVEIKNDKIYVDGEMVSTIKNAKSEDHKIVINHKPKPHAKPA